ncbi:MAG: hypothetical protein WCX82_00185 [archaeon]|jgi:hypothetical protein
MKNEKMKWYILIAAALLVGAIIGYFATANLSTTGNACQNLNNLNGIVVDAEEGYFISYEDCIGGGGSAPGYPRRRICFKSDHTTEMIPK